MNPDEVNRALGHYLNDADSGELVVEDSTTVQVGLKKKNNIDVKIKKRSYFF